jgi:hypothetical protein
MAAVNLVEVAKKAAMPKVERIDASDATSQRFFEAMEKAGANPEANSQQVAPQQIEAVSNVLPPKQVTPTQAVDTATTDAQERTRRALDLDPVRSTQPAPVHGDTILHGLQKIRGFFNAQEARLNDIVSGPTLDTRALMRLQMAVAEFSLMSTVASKLTGDSTRALESLLKGQ